VVTRWQISVDPVACIGSGACAATAPQHFRLERVDGRDQSHPIEEIVEPDDFVLGAALSCPTEAITVREQSSGTVLAPEL
jgi:ferredoxin